MSKKFCDFCSCRDCRKGCRGLFHALTKDGRWICDVCYMYDLCTADRKSNPCKSKDCVHRPKLVGDWIEFCKK